MALFCIPKNLVEKLKASALKGEVDIKKLYEMSSEERRNFFAEHTDEVLGKFINTEFEKAMISKQQGAILDWAKSVFTPKAQEAPVYKTILDKIQSLDELGVLDPASEKAFLQDLVSDKLGANVSAAEVKGIKERAEKIDAAQEALGNDLGNPEKLNENIEFFKAKKVMDDYLQSLTPASNLKVLTGTIGRGMMLASIKSPLMNIGSNMEVGFMEALARRISTGQLKGADNQLALDYMKMANKIYQASGYDISRMMNLSDSGASGERVLGETVHAQGAGAIRKIGRGVEDVVFKQLMGAPDVAFSSAHFADSVNLNSLKMAKGDVTAARDMMADAMRITPQTPEGELLRNQGIMDAQKATWTDNSWTAKFATGIRKIFNDASGDVRVGDYLFPFVKTSANVIGTGIDYAGGGVIKSLIDTVKAIKGNDANFEMGSEAYLRKIIPQLVRSGLGLTAAFAISRQLNDDDFVGAYDPARAQIEQLRDSNYNAIRIGGKWVSVDWLGPLAIPVSAMMYAKKYGSTPGDKTFQYGESVLGSLWNLPGVSDAAGYVQAKLYQKNQPTLEEASGAAGDYISSQIYSRLVPSFISDIAKATDPYQRETGKGVAGIMAKIPGLREKLPIKNNIFGEQIKSEPAWSSILIGSRLKTDKETPLIKEISDISSATGKGVTFTNWDKSPSKQLAQFKQKYGQDRYNQAKIDYGNELKSQLESAINNPSYKSLTDEEKLSIINNQDADAMKTIFNRYGFKYSPPIKSNTPKL